MSEAEIRGGRVRVRGRGGGGGGGGGVRWHATYCSATENNNN